MAFPVYVLLPDGVEWTEVVGTTAQTPKPVRWYLRQQMPLATTQVGVLVDEADDRPAVLTQVIARAAELGGVAIDATTQELLESSAEATRT